MSSEEEPREEEEEGRYPPWFREWLRSIGYEQIPEYQEEFLPEWYKWTSPFMRAYGQNLWALTGIPYTYLAAYAYNIPGAFARIPYYQAMQEQYAARIPFARTEEQFLRNQLSLTYWNFAEARAPVSALSSAIKTATYGLAYAAGAPIGEAMRGYRAFATAPIQFAVGAWQAYEQGPILREMTRLYGPEYTRQIIEQRSTLTGFRPPTAADVMENVFQWTFLQSAAMALRPVFFGGEGLATGVGNIGLRAQQLIGAGKALWNMPYSGGIGALLPVISKFLGMNIFQMGVIGLFQEATSMYMRASAGINPYATREEQLGGLARWSLYSAATYGGAYAWLGAAAAAPLSLLTAGGVALSIQAASELSARAQFNIPWNEPLTYTRRRAFGGEFQINPRMQTGVDLYPRPILSIPGMKMADVYYPMLQRFGPTGNILAYQWSPYGFGWEARTFGARQQYYGIGWERQAFSPVEQDYAMMARFGSLWGIPVPQGVSPSTMAYAMRARFGPAETGIPSSTFDPYAGGWIGEPGSNFYFRESMYAPRYRYGIPAWALNRPDLRTAYWNLVYGATDWPIGMGPYPTYYTRRELNVMAIMGVPGAGADWTRLKIPTWYDMDAMQRQAVAIMGGYAGPWQGLKPEEPWKKLTWHQYREQYQRDIALSIMTGALVSTKALGPEWGRGHFRLWGGGAAAAAYLEYSRQAWAAGLSALSAEDWFFWREPREGALARRTMPRTDGGYGGYGYAEEEEPLRRQFYPSAARAGWTQAREANWALTGLPSGEGPGQVLGPERWYGSTYYYPSWMTWQEYQAAYHPTKWPIDIVKSIPIPTPRLPKGVETAPFGAPAGATYYYPMDMTWREYQEWKHPTGPVDDTAYKAWLEKQPWYVLREYGGQEYSLRWQRGEFPVQRPAYSPPGYQRPPLGEGIVITKAGMEKLQSGEWRGGGGSSWWSWTPQPTMYLEDILESVGRGVVGTGDPVYMRAYPETYGPEAEREGFVAALTALIDTFAARGWSIQRRTVLVDTVWSELASKLYDEVSSRGGG
jgi:hypothetical protein